MPDFHGPHLLPLRVCNDARFDLWQEATKIAERSHGKTPEFVRDFSGISLKGRKRPVPPDHILSFGPFRLNAANAQLWCETQPVRLTAKALQVLSYLAERPGQLVTKDELFGAVWPETVVSDATLTSNIQAVRQALSDDARSPQYIETVHRRGFRFLGEVVSSQQEEERQKAKVEEQGEQGYRQKRQR